MKTLNYLSAITLSIFIVSTAHGFEQKETPGDKSRSEYQGQEAREIKSLSERDIEALQRGAGWGLARAAELNGVPGPAHVLELQKPLNLSEMQIDEIQQVWQDMNTAARKQGLVYIRAEQEIEHFFKEGKQDKKRLSALLQNSALSLADLRKIHLVAHLKTRPLLTKHQIMMYNKLRGYGGGTYQQQSPQHRKGHHHVGH